MTTDRIEQAATGNPQELGDQASQASVVSSERRAFLSQAALGAGVMAAAGLTAASAEAKSWMDCENPRAGSEELLKMIEQGKGMGQTTIPREHLLEFVRIVRDANVKLVDWCQYGQPALDGFCGTVHALPDHLPKLIATLTGKPHLWRWGEVFPLGFPFPDRYGFRLGAGSAPRGVIITEG